MINKLTWSNFKNIINSKSLSIQMVESDIVYKLSAFDNQLTYLCDIIKENPVSSEQLDFETNYKSLVNKAINPKDKNGRSILTISPFTDASGFRFRGQSFSDTVLANSTKSIDFKIVQERYINGGRLLVSNAGENDTITFQVVDKDNILGFGSNVVLDEFISNYFIPNTDNLEVRLDYPAKIMAGLYTRLIYTNTNTLQDCLVKCNLYLHWKSV
jgi:hypothetical protein